MITLLCLIFMALIFGRLGIFAFKATWGLTKIILFLVFLPVIIIGFVLSGLFALAIPILAIVGLGVLFGGVGARI